MSAAKQLAPLVDVPAVAALEISVVSLSNDVDKFCSLSFDASEQVPRVVISDQASLGRAGELVKAITTTVKDLETTRKSYTDPLDAAKASIMDLFREPKASLEAAKSSVVAKQNEWLQSEQKRLAAEAAENRRKAEEEARRQAEILADSGDIEEAALAADAAEALASRQVEPVRIRSTGGFGTTTSGTRVVTGEVTNAREFLTALLASTLLGDVVGLSDVVEFKKSGVNKLAKSLADKKSQIPGLTVSDRMEARSR